MMTTATATATGAEALDRNGNAAQSGSSAPGAIGSFYQGAAGDGPIVQRLVSSGPTGNERQSGPRPATVTEDDQGGGDALTSERNTGGAWYVGRAGRGGIGLATIAGGCIRRGGVRRGFARPHAG